LSEAALLLHLQRPAAQLLLQVLGVSSQLERLLPMPV
jgi:hypothetical protein